LLAIRNTVQIPLFAQLRIYNLMASALDLHVINEIDPRMDIHRWNSSLREERVEFRQGVTRELHSIQGSNGLNHLGELLAEFFTPVKPKRRRYQRDEVVVFLVPGGDPQRFEWAGSEALRAERQGAIVHVVASGRCSPDDELHVHATLLNTEADRGREIIQRMGIKSHRIHAFTEARDTDGNVSEFVAALTELVPLWDHAVIVTHSYHILRCSLATRLALAFHFGLRKVDIEVVKDAEHSPEQALREQEIGLHVEGFFSGLWDWATLMDSRSEEQWLGSRSLL
jgi:hypothetical protein